MLLIWRYAREAQKALSRIDALFTDPMPCEVSERAAPQQGANYLEAGPADQRAIDVFDAIIDLPVAILAQAVAFIDLPVAI